MPYPSTYIRPRSAQVGRRSVSPRARTAFASGRRSVARTESPYYNVQGRQENVIATNNKIYKNSQADTPSSNTSREMNKTSQKSRTAPSSKPPTGSDDTITGGQYLFGPTLGQGTFGKVKLGKHVLTNEPVAIKVLEKSKIKEIADVERVTREIRILKKVRHQNIVQLFEVIDSPKHIFLVTEYLDGGELFDYIVRRKRLPELEACRLFHDILDGLDYAHRLGIVHRDLKPENLLLQPMPNGSRRVKIIDFGLSNIGDDSERSIFKTACGSPCYASPEMIAGHRYQGSRSDMWSLGVVLFAMVSGYLPFEDKNTGALYDKILNCRYQAPGWLSPGCRDLISHILHTDPLRRFSAADIRRHPWFAQLNSSVSPPKAGPSCRNDMQLPVLDRCIALGMDEKKLEESVVRNAHNHYTTTYYLIAEKLIRRGLIRTATREKQVKSEKEAIGESASSQLKSKIYSVNTKASDQEEGLQDVRQPNDRNRRAVSASPRARIRPGAALSRQTSSNTADLVKAPEALQSNGDQSLPSKDLTTGNNETSARKKTHGSLRVSEMSDDGQLHDNINDTDVLRSDDNLADALERGVHERDKSDQCHIRVKHNGESHHISDNDVNQLSSRQVKNTPARNSAEDPTVVSSTAVSTNGDSHVTSSSQNDATVTKQTAAHTDTAVVKHPPSIIVSPTVCKSSHSNFPTTRKDISKRTGQDNEVEEGSTNTLSSADPKVGLPETPAYRNTIKHHELQDTPSPEKHSNADNNGGLASAATNVRTSNIDVYKKYEADRVDAKDTQIVSKKSASSEVKSVSLSGGHNFDEASSTPFDQASVTVPKPNDDSECTVLPPTPNSHAPHTTQEVDSNAILHPEKNHDVQRACPVPPAQRKPLVPKLRLKHRLLTSNTEGTNETPDTANAPISGSNVQSSTSQQPARSGSSMSHASRGSGDSSARRRRSQAAKLRYTRQKTQLSSIYANKSPYFTQRDSQRLSTVQNRSRSVASARTRRRPARPRPVSTIRRPRSRGSKQSGRRISAMSGSEELQAHESSHEDNAMNQAVQRNPRDKHRVLKPSNKSALDQSIYETSTKHSNAPGLKPRPPTQKTNNRDVDLSSNKNANTQQQEHSSVYRHIHSVAGTSATLSEPKQSPTKQNPVTSPARQAVPVLSPPSKPSPSKSPKEDVQLTKDNNSPRDGTPRYLAPTAATSARRSSSIQPNGRVVYSSKPSQYSAYIQARSRPKTAVSRSPRAAVSFQAQPIRSQPFTSEVDRLLRQGVYQNRPKESDHGSNSGTTYGRRNRHLRVPEAAPPVVSFDFSRGAIFGASSAVGKTHIQSVRTSNYANIPGASFKKQHRKSSEYYRHRGQRFAW